MLEEEVVVGNKYKVIENRNSNYGGYRDIIWLEGKTVTVIDKEKAYLVIKDEEGDIHHCRGENLTLIDELTDWRQDYLKNKNGEKQ